MKAQAKYKDEISLIEMEAGDGKYRRMICMPYYCIFDWMLSLPIKQMKSHLQTPMRLYQDFMDDVSRKNSIDLMQLCRLLFLDEFCEDIGPTDTEKQIIPNAGTNLAYRYLITKDRSFTILARYACQSHLIMLEARRDHHGVAGQTHEPDDGTRLRALN